MLIIPTQYVAGCRVGEKSEVDDDFGQWLITNGYATSAGSKSTKDEQPKSPAPSSDESSEADSAAPESAPAEKPARASAPKRRKR